jgi:hypothetical protein
MYRKAIKKGARLIEMELLQLLDQPNTHEARIEMRYKFYLISDAYKL